MSWIEARGRLVDQQQLWILDQRASDADALSLPAGKFVRPFVDHIVEADAFQQAKRFIDIGLRELAQKAAPKPDIAEPPGEHVLHYGQALDQGIFLKNHAHLTARPAKSPSSERG